ncbi:helix-turn-helix domain-containing protein [uncultured Thiothrix sp.]|uniref:GlxA family transcriptional regulator n=1 Tax=uncultured Thiothrix sp. TaxID=223185 RepID=UPI00262B75AF|nr:helix-turn-helix domain-containing protein [uncultured Thiothrix sp.]HMT93790.1 helix-turn-helix domain-containing protein [Thiolinea sp.]
MQTAILLANQFIMLNLDLVMDILRIANRVLASPQFQWQVLTVDNIPAVSCNAYIVQPACHWADCETLDCILVITGFEPETGLHPPVLAWLQQQYQAGVKVGCVDTGAFALAAAGVRPTVPMAIHWDSELSFRQQFPNLPITTAGVSCGEDFFSASGGLSVVDMMLNLLSQYLSPTQLKDVNQILYCQGSTTAVSPERSQLLNPQSRIERAETYMHAALAQPLSLNVLAKMVNMHPRTFSRQFSTRYGISPIQYYRQLRLKHAQLLLLQTQWPVSRIAELCGFSELSNFSACFSQHYGISPQQLRVKG